VPSIPGFEPFVPVNLFIISKTTVIPSKYEDGRKLFELLLFGFNTFDNLNNMESPHKSAS
jgi:hypothetical protein